MTILNKFSCLYFHNDWKFHLHAYISLLVLVFYIRFPFLYINYTMYGNVCKLNINKFSTKIFEKWKLCLIFLAIYDRLIYKGELCKDSAKFKIEAGEPINWGESNNLDGQNP